MDTHNNKDNREERLIIIKKSYTTELSDIISLANKLGWKAKELEEHPELLLHVFYEYLDIIK
tara:strand:+ start:322 stop:507 length:186 start_codon:yes stop_codon:yes gene_type:complete